MDNNRLIAEFMGVELVDTNFPSDGYWFDLMSPMFDNSNYTEWADMNEGKIRVPISALCYNDSWDWLMPVVEKIESLELNGNYFFIEISKEKVHIKYFRDGEEFDNIFCYYYNSRSKFDTVYIAVVEFIKWYNEQK